MMARVNPLYSSLPAQAGNPVTLYAAMMHAVIMDAPLARGMTSDC